MIVVLLSNGAGEYGCRDPVGTFCEDALPVNFEMEFLAVPSPGAEGVFVEGAVELYGSYAELFLCPVDNFIITYQLDVKIV